MDIHLRKIIYSLNFCEWSPVEQGSICVNRDKHEWPVSLPLYLHIAFGCLMIVRVQ